MNDRRITQQILLPTLIGLIAIKGLSNKNEYYTDLSADVIAFFLKDKNEKEKCKLLSRTRSLSSQVVLVATDKRDDQVNTHKLILILHNVAERLIDGGFKMHEKVVELFQPFLEIEGAQRKTVEGKEITDEDWLNLKASADKLSGKVFNIINDDLEYIK